MAHEGWYFWIDTGGTFTDCLAKGPDGRRYRSKVLSSGAIRGRISGVLAENIVRLELDQIPPRDFFKDYDFMIPGVEGWVSRVLLWNEDERCLTLQEAVSKEVAQGAVCELRSPEEAPVLAIRWVLGARLEDSLDGIDLRLATTWGTNALLEEKGAEVALFINEGFEDLLRIRDQKRPDIFALAVETSKPLHGPVVGVSARLDAHGVEIEKLDFDAIRSQAEVLLRDGITVATVCLIHSYQNPSQELQLAAFLRNLGFDHVSCSSELAPVIKLLPRAETSVVDAYLSPVMEGYLDRIEAVLGKERLSIMTSAGGLVSRQSFRPKDSLLSGPAGGVVGTVAVGKSAGFNRLIAFDMGGTSTDVARYEGEYDYEFSHKVGRAQVFAPALKIESVAAGGGSVCAFDGVSLTVGPTSAGAYPGPACYGAGGPLTLTDVNLLCGRLEPSLFGLPIFPEKAQKRLDEVILEVSKATGTSPDSNEILVGFLDIADERMADAVRKISVREGYDCRKYGMIAFGGAGGLHVCGVARRLGVSSILHPNDSGLLSARGLMEARVEKFAEQQLLKPLEDALPILPELLRSLKKEALECLAFEGVKPEFAEIRVIQVELRFLGQDASLILDYAEEESLAESFKAAYKHRFGYCPEGREIELVTLRVVASSIGDSLLLETFENQCDEKTERRESREKGVSTIRRDRLAVGEILIGPIIVQDVFSTVFIDEGWRGLVGSAGSIRLKNIGGENEGALKKDHLEVVELELFTNRLKTLVDEMGVLLQRVALSTNVKERLDFSCALLDVDGELIVNAPHIPVHLGALGLCVRQVIAEFPLNPGDTLVTNHPGWGGSHLPDVTLISSVYDANERLLGYVANRAHHAEIGGIRPGSMPPDASSLEEEGVIIAPTYIGKGGEIDWEPIRMLLCGGKYPSRAVEENLADLKAQLAANLQGSRALSDLATSIGGERVGCFMRGMKARASRALKTKLGQMPEGEFRATQWLDDGTPLEVKISIHSKEMLFDFTGTGPVHGGNFNATPAIVRSAILYVLRLMVAEEIPLNEGLMSRVEVCLPNGLLNPAFPKEFEKCPAVVGGNVETSQRLVDTLIKALGLCACSQGTMNNLIFGNEKMSYYETIGGGCGAGPEFNGASAVQSHMTNTAITDPEILEYRYPVRLRQFAIREDSGGLGRYRGGDGIIRDLLFLEPVSLSLFTQHRTVGPFGMKGGQPGLPGDQMLIRSSGEKERLSSVVAVEMEKGDRLVIRTPGGGGYGEI